MAIEIAVIGATGNVGRKVVDMLLSNPLISSCKLTLFASSESAGKTLEIKGVSYPILDTKKANFSQFNLCIFNTESEVSAQFIPPALQAGAYVVDSSAHFRLQQDVPLIVPPVNLALIDLNSRLYAHANCVVSPIATTIKPLHDRFPILRINAVTFQSTSGAGKAASDECLNETAALIKQEPYQRTHFDKQIAFNVIPQVGSIMQDGATTEEFKIIHEVKKIVNPAIAVTATAVRVPVMVGHSIALSVEFTESIEQKSIAIDSCRRLIRIFLGMAWRSTRVM